MKKACTNIYKLGRLFAKQTLEEAADGLGVSVRCLAYYESGAIIPPEDVVCRMVEIYRQPSLAYKHLKQNNEVGRRCLPEIHEDGLSQAVLRLQMRHAHLHNIEPTIVSIALDNIIDEEESPVWAEIRNDLGHMASAVISLMFYPEKKNDLMLQARG